MYRNTHARVPAGVIWRYAPSPTAYRPGFVSFPTATALSFLASRINYGHKSTYNHEPDFAGS